MGKLTQSTPKPLLPLAGVPLIEYHVRALASIGVEEIIINVSWLGDQIVDALGPGDRFGIRLVYSKEPDEPLETAGGIANALALLGSEPFLVVNGDVWSDFPLHHLRDLCANHFEESDYAHLVMVNNPAHNVNGDFNFVSQRATLLECEYGRLCAESFTEAEKDLEPRQSRLTFSGIGLYRADFFSSVSGRAALGPLLKEAIAQDRMSATRYNGLWWDVGTSQRLEQVERFLRG